MVPAQPTSSKPPDGDTSRLRAALAVLTLAFLALSIATVPRLTNNLLSDIEFTGWSGPIAERLARGEVPYVDFVLPIPLGSFVILAAVQKVLGRALLIDELSAAAFAHYFMALLGYAIVRPFTSRLNSALVAATTAVIVIAMHKECFYDHSAQLVAWSSLAVGIRAVLEDRPKRRRILWLATGTLASATLIFKQSTGTGIMLGWAAALGYLVLVEVISRQPTTARKRLRDLSAFAGGCVIGLVLLWLVLAAFGSSLGAYYQSVFADGPGLKGGRKTLVFNLLSYMLRFNAVPSSLLFSLLIAWIALRMGKRGGLRLWKSPDAPERFSRGNLWAYSAIVATTLGGAALIAFIATDRLPGTLVFWTNIQKHMPRFGLGFGCLFFVAHLRRVAPVEASTHEPGPRRGHVINAVVIAALATSLMHNTSFPGFRPFYDNNPIIPVALMLLFVALDAAQLPKLKMIVFALCMTSVISDKYQRGLAANTPVGRRGHWAGLKVSSRGHEVIKAALRARRLAGPSETVLVLPDDVQLAALIGRPRPPLRGAILFVDQYPERLLADDLKALDKALPKVIVIHPRDKTLWQTQFAIWNSRSATQKFIKHVQTDLLPKHYRLDSSYPTAFARKRAHLDVYVRTTPSDAAAAR